MQHGDFTHVEIPADEPARAKSFYQELFGWTFPPEVEGFEGYYVFITAVGEQGMGGAIGKRGEMAPEKMRSYINVDSVEDALARVKELGGTVISEKADVPGQGAFGVFADTEGNELALWEPLPRDG